MVVCVSGARPDSPLGFTGAIMLPLRWGVGVVGVVVILLGWEPGTVDPLLPLPQWCRGEAQKWAVITLGLASAALWR